MLEYPGKLLVVKHTIFDGSFTEHVINLFLSQPVFIDHSGVFLIKHPECILDNILRICSLQSFPKKSEEHGEVDGARGVAHHLIQVLLSWVFTKRGQHVMKIFIVNEPISVSINHIEGFFKLLYLFLVEHGEHITGCSLSSFLFLPSSLARRHGGVLVISCRSESSNI